MNENLKNKALEILQKEQTQLEDVYEKQSEYQAPQTVEKISVVQGPDGRWSKNVIEEKNTFLDESVIGKLEKELELDTVTLQTFCKEFDDQIISFNSQINDLKSQIVVLSTEAIGRNCWPGIAYSTTTTSGTIRNTGIGSTTQNYGGDFSYQQDRDGLKIYESMSGPNSNYVTDNPFSPDSVVTLSASYSGFGYENVRQDDGGSIIGTARTTISGIAGTHLGPKNVGAFRAYAGVGVAPEATITDLTGSAGDSRCISIASSISSLLSQIDTLRTQRELVINRNNLNSVKSVKSEKELQTWGTKNLNRRIESRKSKNSSAISAIQNLS